MSKHVTTSIPAHGTSAGDTRGATAQRAIDLDIDENGSPVTLDPADWLVCFVPGLQRQWWHRFVPGWQHVFMIRPVSPEQWLLFEPWWSRLLISTLDTVRGSSGRYSALARLPALTMPGGVGTPAWPGIAA